MIISFSFYMKGNVLLLGTAPGPHFISCVCFAMIYVGWQTVCSATPKGATGCINALPCTSFDSPCT